MLLVALVLRPEVFFAADSRRDDFLAEDFLPPDFLLVDFLPADFRAPDFRPAVRRDVALRADFRVDFRVDFRAADFRRVDFFAALRFRPALRADFFRPPFFAAIGKSPRFEDHPATVHQKHWRHPSLFDSLPVLNRAFGGRLRFHRSLTT